MAFVNVGATSFKGQDVLSSKAHCSLRPCVSASAAAAGNRRRSPRMSFSSIDTPEAAVSKSDSDFETKEAVLYAAYKHVFGNAYVMESERSDLAVAESDFKMGTISVRELVRAMAKSDAYKKRFFAKSGPYRFVELNCKHLLGRGPHDQGEIGFHVEKLMTEGYDAEIDSYIDSGEYEERFGDDGVPRFVYEGQYEKNDYFNRLNVMRMHWDGCSTSTKYGSTAPGTPMGADLLMGHGSYVNGFVKVLKGLPAGFRPEGAMPKAPFAGVPANPRAPLKTRIEVAPGCYQVFEIPAMELPADVEPQWKKDMAALNPGVKYNGVFY